MMGVVELEGEDIRHVSDNPATCRFFGIAEEALKGKLASELGVPQETVQNWLKHYRQAKVEGSPVRFEYKHPSENGIIWLSATVSAIHDLSTMTERYAYVVQDITEQKELASTIQRQNEELEAEV